MMATSCGPSLPTMFLLTWSLTIASSTVRASWAINCHRRSIGTSFICPTAASGGGGNFGFGSVPTTHNGETSYRRPPSANCPIRHLPAYATAPNMECDDVGDHYNGSDVAKVQDNNAHPTRCSSRDAASIIQNSSAHDGLLIITCDASGRGVRNAISEIFQSINFPAIFR